MGGDYKVSNGSDTNVMSSVLLQKNSLSCDPLWVSASSASLHGGKTMVHFEDVGAEDSMETPFLHSLVKEEITGDEDYDLCISQPGKKRRLSATQVQFLERNFEVENKLEPERKIQLAKELGLQPRQVAIWFQNRRARFKNKQLEKDYDSLKASFDKLKSDYDILLKEKESLKNQVASLKEKLLAGENGVKSFEEPPINAIISVKEGFRNNIPNDVSDKGFNEPVVTFKQEDASSAKSDVFDSDSPHSFLEPADSSNVFEPDQSDFSQDEDDELCRSFLPPPCFTKLYHDPPANSCNFEFPIEDQSFWSWNY